MVGAQPPARPSYARARGSGRRGHAWLWGLRAARGSSNRWVGVDYAQIGFRAPALSRALSIQCTGRARPCLTDDDDDDNDDNGDNDDDDACLVWCLRLPPAPLIQATTGSASLPSVRFATGVGQPRPGPRGVTATYPLLFAVSVGPGVTSASASQPAFPRTEQDTTHWKKSEHMARSPPFRFRQRMLLSAASWHGSKYSLCALLSKRFALGPDHWPASDGEVGCLSLMAVGSVQGRNVQAEPAVGADRNR